jgi:ferredoxin
VDMPKHGQRCSAEALCISSAPPTYEENGEGGIRTLGDESALRVMPTPGDFPLKNTCQC